MPNLEQKEILDISKKILEAVDSLAIEKELESATWSQRLADKVVSFIGSWTFIVVQSALMALWIGANAVWLSQYSRWDPYPFILLNLFLSFQAAYASPLILMAHNRAATKDRRKAQQAYRTIEHIEMLLCQVAERIKAIKNGNHNGNGKIKPEDTEQVK